jgi:hypothetical protein
MSSGLNPGTDASIQRGSSAAAPVVPGRFLPIAAGPGCL